MRIQKNQSKTVEVKHPNHPEVKVWLKRLTRMETIEYLSNIENMRTPIPLRDPETKEYVYENGNIKIIYKDNFNPKVIVDMLAQAIKRWEGIEDENGIPLNPSKDSMDILFSPELDITKEDGTTESFWSYVLDQTRDEAVMPHAVELDPK